MRLLKLLFVVLTIQVSASAWAHLGEGHNMSFMQGVMHFFSEPAHLIYLSVILVSTVVLFLIYRQASKRIRSKIHEHSQLR